MGHLFGFQSSFRPECVKCGTGGTLYLLPDGESVCSDHYRDEFEKRV